MDGGFSDLLPEKSRRNEELMFVYWTDANKNKPTGKRAQFVNKRKSFNF